MERYRLGVVNNSLKIAKFLSQGFTQNVFKIGGQHTIYPHNIKLHLFNQFERRHLFTFNFFLKL